MLLSRLILLVCLSASCAASSAANDSAADQELDAAHRKHLAQVEAQIPLLGQLVELQYRCKADTPQKQRLQRILSTYERRLVSAFGVELQQRYRDGLVAGAQAMGERMDAAEPARREAVCRAFISTIEAQLSSMEARIDKQPEVLP